jgi:tetratricopeptide (TPR) repeat protein
LDLFYYCIPNTEQIECFDTPGYRHYFVKLTVAQSLDNFIYYLFEVILVILTDRIPIGMAAILSIFCMLTLIGSVSFTSVLTTLSSSFGQELTEMEKLQELTKQSEEVNKRWERTFNESNQRHQPPPQAFQSEQQQPENYGQETEEGIEALNQGNTLYELGRYEEAIEYYDRALAIDPSNIKALNDKGLSLYYSGRYEEAIEYSDRALAIDPNNVIALITKGLCLHKLERYEEAMEYYDRALALDPNNISALSNKGVSQNNLGRYEEAIEYFDRALSIEPNNVSILGNKGVSLKNLGRYEEAIEYYDRVLAIDPNNISALSNKGLSLNNLGRYEEAIEYYDRALALDPRIAYGG